ncbi:MAG: dihydroorotase [Melioribacteraceae bacterium]|nr:MAG: dihydroorotase [Melioribacteraceae bacterium]
MKIILKDIRLLNPEQDLDKTADLLIEDGVISKIGNLEAADLNNAEVFEYENTVVVPGLFDMHVHLREPGREDEETIKSGSNAAAAGGFTSIACMPNTKPAIDSAEFVNSIIMKSANHLVEVLPVAAITPAREGDGLAPIAELVEAGAIAFSDDEKAVKNASVLRAALEYTNMYGKTVIEHCEDSDLSEGVMNESLVSTMLGLPSKPTISEEIVVMRDIALAEYTGGKLHIAHVSSKRSVELVREAKARGVNITAEVTPHHFSLTDEAVKTFDTNYRVNPPLRGKEDVEAILEGLKDGTIDCIASDHSPRAIEEKDVEFIYAADGMVGLETSLGLALSELVHKSVLDLAKLTELMAINPRKVLGLPVPKIEVGAKAELTVLDPDAVWTVDVKKFKSKSKNSPFDKKLLTGKSVAVINRGKMFTEDGFKDI